MFCKKIIFFEDFVTVFSVEVVLYGKAINTDYAKDRLVHIKTFGKR